MRDLTKVIGSVTEVWVGGVLGKVVGRWGGGAEGGGTGSPADSSPLSRLCPAVQRAVSLFSLNDPALSPEVPPAHSPVHSHLSLERGPPTPRTTPTMR